MNTIRSVSRNLSLSLGLMFLMLGVGAGAQCVAPAIRPEITSTLTDGIKEVSGKAQQPTTIAGHGCSARVELWLQVIPGVSPTSTTDGHGNQARVLLGTAAVTGGVFNIKLSDPLFSGQAVFVTEIVTDTPTGASSGTDLPPVYSEDVIRVAAFGNWGLVKAYFTSGFLLSEEQGSFSQSNLFMAFTLDKTWKMPGYYFSKTKKDKRGNEVEVARLRWPPGINSFFETRLTAIPVSACSQPATPGGGSGGSSSSATPSCTTQSNGATALDTFLSSRKSARLDLGVYLPFTLTGWTFRGTPNTLFLAPIAKLGFDTPVSDLNQAQPSTPTGGTATSTGPVTAVNPTNFYTFYNFGARFGHYAMTSSRDEAPDTVSYLDFVIGRFSNLESLVQPTSTSPLLRQRLWRVSAEGILKIPSTPLIIGFNANVGMNNPNAKVVRKAGDDLRFLFGAKFDVAKLLAKVGAVSP